jgi:hypothetical protein
VEISNPQVQNPILIERIPDDQLNLTITDRLVPVIYVSSTHVSEKFIGSGYVRVALDERLPNVRERLREDFRGEGADTTFSVRHWESKRSMRINEQTDLWNTAHEWMILEISVRAVD